MTQVAGENSTSTFAGWFKEIYADKLKDVRPDGVRFYNDAPFVPKRRETGNTYNQPVALTHCHGFTYAVADEGAFAINTPVAGVMKNATVGGAQLLLEERIDYETMARGEGSMKAFGSATRHMMRNMVKSFFKREEIRHLYGCGAGGGETLQSGIFRIGTQVTDSGTTQVYNVTVSSWAPGIMQGLEGCPIDIYEDDGAGGLPSSKLNATADVIIAKVDFTNKRVTLTGVEAELDDLDTEVNTTEGCYAFFKGSFDKEPIGYTTIAKNTGSLFGIDGATYGLWQGNEYPVGSTELTFEGLLKAVDLAVAKGLEGKIRVQLNQRTWTNVMSDLVAARVYDSSYTTRKLANGTQAIEFMGQSGVLDIVAAAYMKEGIALAYQLGEVERVGATKMTFKMPGSGDDYVYQLPSNAGYGVRAYSNEAPFTACPGRSVLLTGIVNS